MEGLFKRLIHAILTVKYSESPITDESLESLESWDVGHHGSVGQCTDTLVIDSSRYQVACTFSSVLHAVRCRTAVPPCDI